MAKHDHSCGAVPFNFLLQTTTLITLLSTSNSTFWRFGEGRGRALLGHLSPLVPWNVLFSPSDKGTADEAFESSLLRRNKLHGSLTAVVEVGSEGTLIKGRTAEQSTSTTQNTIFTFAVRKREISLQKRVSFWLKGQWSLVIG